MTLVSPEDIAAARPRVEPVTTPTPLRWPTSLSELLGRPIGVKPEHLQRTGSFKVRGAANLIAGLAPGTAVVAASAGNHAQGVALAARLNRLEATIFLPRSAALPKIHATEAYGAKVCLEGDDVSESLEAGQRYATQTGAVFVPPFDHPLVVAGQATVGVEIVEECRSLERGDPEVIVVPVGGGGLIAGVGAAVAAMGARTRIVGVQAEGAASMQRSLAAGRCMILERVETMADGIAVGSPSELTFAHVQAYVDEIVTVTDSEISRAVLLLLERTKAVVEPAGAAAVAALLTGRISGSGTAVAVLSGGNVDPLLLLKLIEYGLSAAGRYLMLRVVLDDRPGALARLSALIAELRINILAVEHHRVGAGLAIDRAEVVLTLETRDADHQRAVVAALESRGYEVRVTLDA